MRIILLLLLLGCDKPSQAPPASSLHEQAFASLQEDMAAHYPYFSLKRVDWAKLCKRYKDRALAAKDKKQFVKTTGELLANLRDLHISIEFDGARIQPYRNQAPMVSHRKVAAALQDIRQIGTVAFTGRTSDGHGILVLSSLAVPDETRAQILTAIQSLNDTRGMLVDLRNNTGGDEAFAQQIAGLFAAVETRYASAKFRSGDAFGPIQYRSIKPTETPYTKPIVVLVGKGTMSSAESFALMFKALPHARVVGQKTRGASGNPAPLTLVNGVTVNYSRWYAMDAKQTPIEGKGVSLDATIGGSADQQWQQALAALRKLTGKQKK